MSDASISPVVAAFDFDRTLTTRDTVFPFMVRVAGVRSMVSIGARNVLRIGSLVVRRDRDGLKELMCREVFRTKRVEDVEHLAVSFSSFVLERFMRSDTVRRLRWHQEQGDVTVVVSASLGTYLHVVGDLLEVDAVICTELEQIDGLYTGALIGRNCRRSEKHERLLEWLADAGLPQSSIMFAYGDSAGDTELLSVAQHAVWVDRTEVSPCP